MEAIEMGGMKEDFCFVKFHWEIEISEKSDLKYSKQVINTQTQVFKLTFIDFNPKTKCLSIIDCVYTR